MSVNITQPGGISIESDPNALKIANNLSDITDVEAAKSNLGITGGGDSKIADYDNGKIYAAGDQVIFADKFYKFNNFVGAAGYAPDSHPSYWTELSAGGGGSGGGIEEAPASYPAIPYVRLNDPTLGSVGYWSDVYSFADKFKTTYGLSHYLYGVGDYVNFTLSTGLAYTNGQTVSFYSSAGYDGSPARFNVRVESYDPTNGIFTGHVSYIDPNTPVEYNLWGVWEVNLGDNNTIGVPEAPVDGTSYVRNNGSWVQASSGGGGGGSVAQRLADAFASQVSYTCQAGTEDGGYWWYTNGYFHRVENYNQYNSTIGMMGFVNFSLGLGYSFYIVTNDGVGQFEAQLTYISTNYWMGQLNTGYPANPDWPFWIKVVAPDSSSAESFPCGLFSMYY